METQEIQKKKTSYTTIWVLVAVTILPVLLAWVYFGFYEYLPHGKGSNNGDLVSPVRNIEKFDLVSLSGNSYNAGALRGKWTLLTVGSSSCSEQCEKNIYALRQIRLATDKDRKRVQRLFVLDDVKQRDKFLLKLEDYKGMAIATGDRGALAEFYSLLDTGNGVVLDRIYIIDPLGNYMMSYPVAMDPELILKDLRRLLKVSKIG